MSMERLTVVAPLSLMEVGQQYNTIPPHVAVFPLFDMPMEHWPSFDRALGEVLANNEVLAVRRPEGVETGRLRALEVTNGRELHGAVHALVNRFGGEFDTGKTGRNWQPLVRGSAEFELAEGQQIELPSLAVFQHKIGQEIVRATYIHEVLSV